MNTYDIVKSLRGELSKFNGEQLDSQYQICWQYSGRLAQGIEADLKRIAGGSPRLFRLEFVINDPYEQGADMCSATVCYGRDDDFEVSIKCWINHEMVKVKVRKRPRSAALEAIANVLDKGEETHMSKFEQ